MRYTEDKWKECPPHRTVERIRQCLLDLGIDVEEAWQETGLSGSAYSLRVELSGLGIGQNGKGTTREFARASAYAELMERLQTGLLFPVEWDESTNAHAGFCFAPDEEEYRPEEENPLLEQTVKALEILSGGLSFLPPDVPRELAKWDFFKKAGSRLSVACVPFFREKDGLECQMPVSLLQSYYFTNGTCAGNSRAEALVQGLSEICERYACLQILRKSLSPPKLPEELVQRHPLYGLVREVRGTEGMDLLLFDASLGKPDKKLPVVAAALIDRIRSRYVIRFGAHPVFEIALERSLTELFQGRNLSRMEGTAVFQAGHDAYAKSYQNAFAFVKAGAGVYPDAFFLARPDWSFTPWPNVEALDNDALYARLRQTVESLGHEIYLRDCGFLGFPCYHLLVPGMSFAFPYPKERYLEKKLQAENLRALREPRTADSARRGQAMEFLRIIRNHPVENSFRHLCRVPFSPKVLGQEVDARWMLALLALSLEQYDQADALAETACLQCEILKGRTGPWRLMRQLLRLRSNLSKEQKHALMNTFYAQEEVQQVASWVENSDSALLGGLPQLPCFRCEECPHNHPGGCAYPAAAACWRRVKNAMAAAYAKSTGACER